MGPTNVALVNYYRADQRVREAQARLDAATKDVRIQERRVNDLAEKHKLASTKLREAQSKQGQLDLDLKSRDAHIDKLRTQQQNAKNNKEYQTFLVEINTGKVDRSKVEEETLKLMEQIEEAAGRSQRTRRDALPPSRTKLEIDARAESPARSSGASSRDRSTRSPKEKPPAAKRCRKKHASPTTSFADHWDGEA